MGASLLALAKSKIIFKIAIVLSQFHTQTTKCLKMLTLKVGESFG